MLQFIFAIFAFATACNGASYVSLNKGSMSGAVYTTWSYPYNLKNTPIRVYNNTSPSISDANDVKSSAEFFVFTGVTSMILSLVLCFVYVLLDRQYRNDQRLPMIDFIITIIWTIFWIAGSSAWAKGVSNIRSQTDWNYIAARSGICSSNPGCTPTDCKL